MMRKIYLFLFLVLFIQPVWAKDAKTPGSSNKDPFAVEALNGFPLAIRQATLEVALHTQLLQEVLKIQKADVAQFKSWVQALPRKTQEELYQVARSPKLLGELTAVGSADPTQLETVLKPYPRELQAPAKDLVQNQMPLLQKISALNQSSDQQFEKLIKDYPPQTRQAYHTVLQHPVILEILERHPDYSYLLAHVYGSNYPTGQARLAKVAPAARKKDEAALAAQKQSLDPANQEITAAANKFCQEADAPLDQVEDPNKAIQATVNYDPYFYSYFGLTPGIYGAPYWYGFPAWGYSMGWW
jgi:hypothetical protein